MNRQWPEKRRVAAWQSKLRVKLQNHKMTQRDLADSAGVSLGMVEKWLASPESKSYGTPSYVVAVGLLVLVDRRRHPKISERQGTFQTKILRSRRESWTGMKPSSIAKLDGLTLMAVCDYAKRNGISLQASKMGRPRK